MTTKKEAPKGIYHKLADIQSKIKGLSKDKRSHNYDYVTGNKLLSFVKPLMDEHKLLLKQEITSIENTRQDYKTKYAEKSEILTKVMMRFTWIDVESGETDVNEFGANGQNDWEKGLGSALTYAERYFLLKYFHIATDYDDIDNPDRKKDSKENKTVSKPPDALKKKSKPKTPISDLNALKNAILKSKENSLKQLANSRTLTKDQANELVKSKAVTKEELSGVEIKG